MRMHWTLYRHALLGIGLAGLGLAACGGAGQGSGSNAMDRFSSDLSFLRQHSEIVVLSDTAGAARVAVAPAYQGRVMTSTTGGPEAPSFGWIGRTAIQSGERQPHM